MEPTTLQYLYLLESKDLYGPGHRAIQVPSQMVETARPPELREKFRASSAAPAPMQQKPIGFAGFLFEPVGEIRQFADSSSGILSRR